MTEVRLAKYGVSMQEAVLARWHVREGDSVSEGDPLADIETDKVEMVIEAPVSGVVRERRVQENDTAVVGEVLAVID